MKTLFKIALCVFLFAACSAADAQCFRGCCASGRCASRVYSYAPTYCGYAASTVRQSGTCGTAYRYSHQESVASACAPCAGDTCSSDARAIRDAGLDILHSYSKELETVEACGSVKACEPVQGCACEGCACEDCQCNPCDCVKTDETQETTEPVEACGSVKTVPYPTGSACANGICPLKAATKTVARTAARTVATGYLAAINAARAVRGLPALALDANLEAGAQAHAQTMARFGALYHAQSGCFENCGINYSIEGQVGAWANSPGHAANMFNPNVTRAGVGAYRDPYGRSWYVLRLR